MSTAGEPKVSPGARRAGVTGGADRARRPESESHPMNAPIEQGVIPFVLSETREGVCTLTLNRGERYNTLSSAMLDALEHALDEVATREDVRVVVIAAKGKGFCAGHDLGELRSHPDEAWQRELFGGCSRAMIKLTQLLTGDTIDAATALDWGLVNRVVPVADLDAAVKVFTDRIVARSAAIIALGKRAFYAQVDRPLSVAYEGTTEAMAWNLVDQDAFEGMDAFLEKRAAKWRSGF